MGTWNYLIINTSEVIIYLSTLLIIIHIKLCTLIIKVFPIIAMLWYSVWWKIFNAKSKYLNIFIQYEHDGRC